MLSISKSFPGVVRHNTCSSISPGKSFMRMRMLLSPLLFCFGDCSKVILYLLFVVFFGLQMLFKHMLNRYTTHSNNTCLIGTPHIQIKV